MNSITRRTHRVYAVYAKKELAEGREPKSFRKWLPGWCEPIHATSPKIAAVLKSQNQTG